MDWLGPEVKALQTVAGSERGVPPRMQQTKNDTLAAKDFKQLNFGAMSSGFIDVHGFMGSWVHGFVAHGSGDHGSEAHGSVTQIACTMPPSPKGMCACMVYGTWCCTWVHGVALSLTIFICVHRFMDV